MRAGLAFSIIILLLAGNAADSQSHWIKTFGYSTDSLEGLATLSDGTSVVAAHFSVVPSEKIRLLHLSSSGSLIWEKQIDSSLDDFVYSLQPVSDGGFILAGSTGNYASGSQGLLLKADSAGNLIWQRRYGPISYFNSAVEVSDGGFFALGSTTFVASWDLVAVRTDASGNVLWARRYGSDLDEKTMAAERTDDGGFLVLGYIDPNGAGPEIGLVLRLNPAGDIVWQKKFFSSNWVAITDFEQTADQGLLLAGETYSGSLTLADGLIIKTDSSGNILWQKTIGTTDTDNLVAIKSSGDGSFIVAGVRTAESADAILMEVSDAGDIQTLASYGDPVVNEVGTIAAPSPDGGLFLGGFILGKGLFLAKTDSLGLVGSCPFAGSLSMSVADASVSVAAGDVASADFVIQDSVPSLVSVEGTLPIDTLCADPPCLFCDDFEDSVLSPDWTYSRGTWVESLGNLEGTSVKRKATALATPAFAGCVNCTVEASIQTGGGNQGSLSVLAWYVDSGNAIEVIMKEENDKWTLRQRRNGVIVNKKRAAMVIDPNIFYTVKLTFDGSSFTLTVNGTPIANIPAMGIASGTVGFKTKRATAKIGSINVY